MSNKYFLYQASILVAAFIACTGKALAQENDALPKVEQQLNIGAVQHSINDSLVSPAKVSGGGLSFNYSISKKGTKRKTILSANYETGSYTTGDEKIKQRGFDISLNNGFNILNKNKKLAIYLGYGLSSHSSYTQPNSKTGNSFSWNSYNAISFYQSYTYAWPQQSIALDISIPVVGVTYRTPKNISNAVHKSSFKEMISSVYSNPSFASLHNNVMFNVQLAYQKKINDRIDLSCKYNFIYRSWTGEQSLTSISNNVGIGVVYKLFK